jgi:16S rRNA (cytidine1402-2'-O)-methyltransferase
MYFVNLVATPIGHPQDLSIRALKILTECNVVICESTKETSKLLRAHGVAGKKYEVLDEDSKAEDLVPLLEMIEKQNCALVSDCGAPGFCDPGADLVRLARKEIIQLKLFLGQAIAMITCNSKATEH